MGPSPKSGYILKFGANSLKEISDKKLVNILKGKDLSRYPDPVEDDPLFLGLWTLIIVKEKAHVRSLTAKTISNILLELKELDVDKLAIIRAFAGSNKASGGKKVRASKVASQTYYEILAAGKRLMREALPREKDVLFFSGARSWSDVNNELPKIIKRLRGNLCVVDPFYGNGTFPILALFGKQNEIRFLSSTLGSRESADISTFKNNLKRFLAEFKNIQIKTYGTPGMPMELHDRYIIADNALVVIGHGIKDLAFKESFVIYLDEKLVSSFLPTLRKTFNDRWRRSKDIPC